MPIRASYFKKVFHFNFKARTSRGPMQDKTSWFIKIENVGQPVSGWGECGPLPGLSVDATPDFESVLAETIERINHSSLGGQDISAVTGLAPQEFSSLIFGLETALLDLHNGGRRIIFYNSFMKGSPIDINGLIWMGDMDFLMDQINQKISQGFRCLKLKVGGLDFQRECDVLDHIRKKYFREDISIRLDANGAFRIDDALYKLRELQKFGIHSIEQPVKPGLEGMEEVCRKSPIPIALDEELIGVNARDEKVRLLKKLKPPFIVLKPTLHGGFKGCGEWISLAQELNTGWWITSALESSIGLNAICQFTANYSPTMPQGLGTGSIYQNNISSPLKVRRGSIYYDNQSDWGGEFSPSV